MHSFCFEHPGKGKRANTDIAWWFGMDNTLTFNIESGCTGSKHPSPFYHPESRILFQYLHISAHKKSRTTSPIQESRGRRRYFFVVCFQEWLCLLAFKCLGGGGGNENECVLVLFGGCFVIYSSLAAVKRYIMWALKREHSGNLLAVHFLFVAWRI